MMRKEEKRRKKRKKITYKIFDMDSHVKISCIFLIVAILILLLIWYFLSNGKECASSTDYLFDDIIGSSTCPIDKKEDRKEGKKEGKKEDRKEIGRTKEKKKKTFVPQWNEGNEKEKEEDIFEPVMEVCRAPPPSFLPPSNLPPSFPSTSFFHLNKKENSQPNKNHSLDIYEYFMKHRYDHQLMEPVKKNYSREELLIPIDGTINKINPSESKGEKMCRQIFEELFGLKFHSVRLNCLKNPETSRNLEFDGYNPTLKMAFEYSGIQHYEFPNPFHKTEEDFIKQVRRDVFKREMADLYGIYLITIPYTVKLNYRELRDYILFYLPENVKKREGSKNS
jgi:hypothetical protein